MKRLIVAASAMTALAGCVALFDFGAYDTARPEAAALDASDEGASVQPFRIEVGSPALSGVTGEPLTVEVTVQRSVDLADAIVLGLAGASDIALSAAPIAPGMSKVSVTLTPGGRHGLAMLSLTATAASYPGFTASAPLTIDVRGKPGTLDTSFANDGVFAPALDFSARDLAVLADDRILVVGGSGSADGAFDVLRILPGGALDPSFGTGGRARALGPTTGGKGATGVAVRPDGTALVVGDRVLPGATFEVFVAALDGRGLKDPSFGDAGVLAFDSLGDSPASVVLVPGRGFVLTNGGFVLGRLPAGQPDVSFGDAGTVESIGPVYTGATLDATGGLVIGGTGQGAMRFSGPLVALSLTATGTTRGSFQGKLPSCVSGRPLLLGSGKVVLVAACAGELGGPASPMLVAVAPDAGVLPTFGDAGIVTEDETVSSITGVVVDGGLATAKQDAYDTSGAQNPRLVLTAFDDKGVLRWTTEKTTFAALVGTTFFAAATDHANRIVVLGTTGADGMLRPIVARFWL